MKSTNTFIEIAEDCPVSAAEEPPKRNGSPTVASLQFDMISGHPYRYTSDDVVFKVHATRKAIPETDLEAERERFFSKGQPCLRSSPLARRYGWGIHNDAEGRVALVPVESDEYRRLASDTTLSHRKAMRSRRA